MEDIERFIKIMQQKRLVNQRELERLDEPSDEHKKLMKELQDLKSTYFIIFNISLEIIVFLRIIYTEVFVISLRCINIKLFTGERQLSKENIIKYLGIITGHKHSIYKLVQSSKNISGLPVPHDYAQYV